MKIVLLVLLSFVAPFNRRFFLEIGHCPFERWCSQVAVRANVGVKKDKKLTWGCQASKQPKHLAEHDSGR